jgi:hypothetical protein
MKVNYNIMKNTITLCLLTMVTMVSGWAQVGIGTTNPQEALHIAGSDATIRLEGLDNTNNTLNKGGTSMYNVMVDANGKLSLGEQPGQLSSESNMSSPVAVQTTPNSDLNSTELYSRSFTLTQRAMVVVTYYISLDFKSYDGSGCIMDGRAKIAHNYWYLGDGTTADTTKTYGMTSTAYSNSDCDTATGYVYNSRSVTIPLEAGTYSVHFNGAVYGGGITSDAAFRATFGDIDRLDIHAIYL